MEISEQTVRACIKQLICKEFNIHVIDFWIYFISQAQNKNNNNKKTEDKKRQKQKKQKKHSKQQNNKALPFIRPV